MDSGRFFSFDPFVTHDPFGYYHHQQQAQSAAGRRAQQGSHWIDDFFPFAHNAEPAPRAASAARLRKGRKRREEEKSTPIEIRVDGPDDPEPTPRREEKTAPIQIRVDGPDDATPPPKANSARKPAMSAEAAAVRVQAAARGFLARRSVRAVLQVHREAKAVARILGDEVELLRGCDRARAAAGESLMGLLLRLDAVRGARGYRRKVTREILALQDAVDALGSPAVTREILALQDAVDALGSPAPEVGETQQAVAVAGDQVVAEESAEVPDAVENGEEMEDDAAAVGAHAEPVAVEVTSEEESAVAPEVSADAGGEMEMGSATTADTPNKMEVVVDGATAAGEPDAGVGAEEEKEPAPGDGNVDVNKPEGSDDADGEWEMVPTAPRWFPVDKKPAEQEIIWTEDAERRMMEMVASLCKRNAQQGALIGALVERVDALERTVRRMEEAERQRGEEGREAATE